ncbi:hypothetical protein SAMN04488057_101264 [Cyclobacterium lianum]|uniref:DUF748 domain-containing protein n=1 Tax=Cyclobacterium lianum TaxID=388280 RepID=A0A1M7IAP5_9BACT|nr:hypothetical protein [Cyclobacterium lianum]SHM37886.1 hypothetical protein SAMN04488057_101264 [Cyclobacterium lianum]
MSEETLHTKQRRNKRKRWLKITGIVVVLLLILQVGLYFLSDWLFREYVKQQVERISDGKYGVEFDRIYLSLFQLGVFVEGFSLFPADPEIFDRQKIPYYRISLDQLEILDIGYSRSSGSIDIGVLRLTSPVVQARQHSELPGNEDASPLQLLEAEIQKSLGEKVQEIHIRDFYVDQANLLIENFISQKSISASNTNLYVQHIHLSSEEQEQTPFGIQGFELDFDDFEIILADSIHRVAAQKVGISSIEKRINAEMLQVVPDLKQTADVYYEISLDHLELADADIMEMFQTAEVDIGDLNLEAPDFVLYTDRATLESERRTTDLYELIREVLASISIQNLTINQGQFLQRGVNSPNKNRIEAEDIHFAMEDVYIGQDEALRENSFFYARDASLEISRARIALADEIHWISGSDIYLSSFEDRVTINEIELKPLVEEDSLSDVSLFEITVPQLEFANANLRKIYNEKIIDIGELMIRSPDVVIKDILGNSSRAKTSLATTALPQLTQGFLKAIYIQKLEMEEGSLVLDNHLRLRQDSLSFGRIDFVLENFQLDEKQQADSSSRIFLADNLRLEINDYALKLSDNLHLFAADKILIDTHDERLMINGFRLKPHSPDGVLPILERYDKTTVLDIEIPEFLATGVDINRAYFEERLFINHIDIPSPIIRWSKYIPGDQSEQEQLERGDILNLISNYFKEVGIDSLSIEEGTFVYENFANETFRTFAENDIAIKIRNFYLDEDIDPAENRTLFAEEVDVNLNNYLFNIANGRYSIVAERIAFNSAREEINTFNVRLMPNSYLDSKVSIAAVVPELSFSGVDLEAFLFDNTLSLSLLRLSDADVKLSINQDFGEEENAEEQTTKSRNLPKTIDVIQIDSILTSNASFNVAYFQEGKDLDLIKTGINLAIADFMLDSARLSEGDIASFFSNMSLGVDDFSLALRDSIHTLNFSKIELDSRDEQILVENLNVVPNTINGIKGVPILKASVPRVAINTRSLQSFQKTGSLDVSLLELTDPEVRLYLDEAGKASLLKPGKEKEESGPQVLQRLLVRNFKLHGGTLSWMDKADTSKVTGLNNLSLILSDLNFDFTQNQTITTDFFVNEDFRFELSDYTRKLPDSLNQVNIGRVLVSEDSLVMHDVRFFPRLGRYAYARKVGKQTDVAELYIPRLVIDGLDAGKFVAEEKLVARSMTLFSPHAEVFRDKRVAEDTTVIKPMPQQLMEAAKMVLELDTLIVSDGRLRYREFPEKGMVPGEINFNKMNARMYPFRLGAFGKERDEAHINASFEINHAARLDVDVAMAFEAPYPIQVRSSVNAFELPVINSILESNAFVTVERGMVQGGNWHFVADQDNAIGEMTLRYNDLKVRLLEERTLREAGGRKGILTFVINALAMRKNNPRPIFKRLVSSPIYVERMPHKFVFNYMWKATFSGLMGSSGLMQPKIPRKEEEEARFDREE